MRIVDFVGDSGSLCFWPLRLNQHCVFCECAQGSHSPYAGALQCGEGHNPASVGAAASSTLRARQFHGSEMSVAWRDTNWILLYLGLGRLGQVLKKSESVGRIEDEVWPSTPTQKVTGGRKGLQSFFPIMNLCVGERMYYFLFDCEVSLPWGFLLLYGSSNLTCHLT